MGHLDYWKETIAESATEHGINLSSDQVEKLAKDVEFAHEMYPEAMGYTSIPNPAKTREAELLRQIERERDAAENQLRSYQASMASMKGYSREDVSFEIAAGRVIMTKWR